MSNQRSGGRRFLVDFGAGLCLCLLVAGIAGHPAGAADDAVPAVHRARHADFGSESASPDVRQVANWVVDSGDNPATPFVIVDKMGAQALAFDGRGSFVAAAPVLMGAARGDDSPSGIGARPG